MPNGDIHKEIGDLKFMVGQINGKLDAFIKIVESNNDNHQKHDERIRKVEGGQKYWSGVASVLGAMGGYILSRLGIHT